MDITVFIGIAVIVFIAGILFIVKGISSEEQEAVPISNPKEIEELKNVFTPPTQKETPAQDSESPAITQPEEVVPAQATPSQTQVNQLTEDNQQLKKQIDEQKDKFEHLEKNLEVLKTEYGQMKDREAGKIKILEDQIANIQREKEQLASDCKSMDEWKAKSESLEKQYQESQKQEVEMKTAIRQLEEEKDGLIRAQKMGVDKSELEVLSNRLAGSIAAVEGLKGENKSLQQLNDDLKSNFRMTEELNTHLMEKEKLMQYELVKNRAQALGLEKICEDFKVQIETMAALVVKEEQTI